MIALAAQRYGLVVRDQTHHGISLFGEVPTQAPGHAVSAATSGARRRQLLAGFPWDRLQVLRCTCARRRPAMKKLSSRMIANTISSTCLTSAAAPACGTRAFATLRRPRL